MESKRKIYEILSVAAQARRNCMNGESITPHWESKWEKNHLPSGSGFDNGTKVVEDECVANLKLVLSFGYHHMDDNGYYDGWSHHKLIVTPRFDGINVCLKCALPRKYSLLKDYILETFEYAITRTIDQSEIDKVLDVQRGGDAKKG
jgi:hypothetical protein